MKKAQHAVEGMIILGVVFLIFFFLYFLYQSKTNDVNLSAKQIKYLDECQSVSSLITQAYALGPNTRYITKIPYSIIIDPNSQRAEVKTVSCTFPTKNVANGAGSSAPFNITVTALPVSIEIINNANTIRVYNVTA